MNTVIVREGHHSLKLGQKVRVIQNHPSVPPAQLERFLNKGGVLVETSDDRKVCFVEPEDIREGAPSRAQIEAVYNRLQEFMAGERQTLRISKTTAAAILVVMDNHLNDE